MFACVGMLDHIIVETSGLKLPLSQIAVVSVMDSKTLSINPFDANVMSLCLFLEVLVDLCFLLHQHVIFNLHFIHHVLVS